MSFPISQLRTGDCLVHLRGRWSLIGLWERYVHIDIVGVLHGRPWAFGATFPTVTACPVANLVKNGRRMMVRRPLDPLSSVGEINALNWLCGEVGTREYDVLGLLNLGWMLPFGLRWSTRRKAAPRERLVTCSAWADEYYEIHHDLDVRPAVACDRYTIPRDFVTSPLLHTVCDELKG